MLGFDKENVEDVIGLTPLQEGILYHYLKDQGDDTYFEQLFVRLSGNLDNACAQKAWNFVAETNEMLRAVYRWQNLKHPIQIVLKAHPVQVNFFDFSNLERDRKQAALQARASEDKKQGFDLHNVAFRVTFCKCGELEHEMCISYNHILLDGWSIGIVLREFLGAYHGFYRDRPPQMPTKTRFKDFLKTIQSQDEDSQRNFWKIFLEDFDSRSELPRIQGNDQNDYRVIIDQATKTQLEEFVKSQRVTPAVLMYSAWGLLLQRYTNFEDVLFGVTLAGRSPKLKGIEEMVGLFINTVPMRIRANGRTKIVELLANTMASLQSTSGFEHTPLVKIKEYCGMPNQDALFDTLVVVENYPLISRFEQSDSTLSVNSFSLSEHTNYGLTIEIRIIDSQIEIIFIYTPELFGDDFIRNLSSHFKHTLQYLRDHPDHEISRVEILSEQQRQQLLIDFNDTTADYPRNTTISQAFEDQAMKCWDKTAVVYNEKQLTYGLLNERANQLARVLRAKGVASECIVGLMVDRSLEMLIGILAILKAGGAYLPIDPTFPDDRINYMLADSEACALLTVGHLNAERNFAAEPLIELDREDYYRGDNSNLTGEFHASDLAYVLYTSGSTGAPKGVMVEHGAIMNTLFFLSHTYPFSAQDTYLLKTAFLFDVSITELFGWFMGGGRLAVLPPLGEKDPLSMMEIIARESITHLNFVPSMFEAFMHVLNTNSVIRLASLKFIFLAGEALSRGLVRRFRGLGLSARLENLYGPTEAAVYASYYSLADNLDLEMVPIGRPVHNAKILNLSRHNSLQPIGVAGELGITGGGLARGYMNNPALTGDKFVQMSILSEGRLYRTGDLARWLPDGNIEFIGRMDNQIKLRGFRIELGEIENQLLQNEAIKEAVVLARQDHTRENYLCAYIIAEKKFSTAELRTFLMKKLPLYMIPSFFVQLDNFPLTRNGKIDRRALPLPEVVVQRNHVAPRTNYERQIAKLWKEVLNSDNIGVHDNFFDIGGNSLHLIRLSSKLNGSFNRPISIVTMFNYPTISLLAGYLQNDDGNGSENFIDRTEEIGKAKNRLKQLKIRNKL